MDGKEIRRANIEDRNDAIKQMGEKAFYSNPSYKYLYDYPCPLCFIFIFNCFLEIYSHCTIAGGMACQKTITWEDIDSYCRVRKITFSQLELNYLLYIMQVADSEMAELDKEK